MTPIFALTTRGLETVTADELATIPGAVILSTTYRRVSAGMTGSLDSLLQLRTVDDVYVNAATWQGVGHTRDTLARIEAWSSELELAQAVQACAAVRPIRSSPLFSVTASFVGGRNYNSDEIKTAAAQGIVAANPSWAYTPDDREADFNLRIFIEHDTAYVGMRLSKSPLHERRYKQVQRTGSLKPSVAAAMLRLAEVGPGMRLLDPCCGAGTILIEGAALGAVPVGGDVDPDAVGAARSNATAAGVRLDIHKWDARTLPIPDGSIDRLVTNLPWGRQIRVDDELARFYRDVCAEMERVLHPEGRVALLTSTPRLLQFDHLRCQSVVEISLSGQTPAIALFSATR